MRPSTLVLASAAAASAARPANESICDYYTTALLKENNATNQYTLLTLVVNTAVIGNYTTPNVGIAVPGILAANATYNGTSVNLVPYFDGALASSNRGGSAGVSVNFLDGGGAAPLEMNMPANSTSSNQYALLTHLYEYFGVLLGCSEYAMTGFPAYAGETSMYQVHKFMALDAYEVGYFIEQVGLSAASFGVATADVDAVGAALTKLFDYKCSAAAQVIPGAGAQLQSICIDADCPTAPNATCDAYAAVVSPKPANSSMMGSNSSMTGSNTSSAGNSTSSPIAQTTNAAGVMKVSASLLAAVGFAAFAWLL